MVLERPAAHDWEFARGVAGIAVLLEVGERAGVPSATMLAGTGLRVGELRDHERLVTAEQSFMVRFEVIAEEGETEAALTLERTVAGAAVAAEPAHERHDMPLEARDFLAVGGVESLVGGRKPFGRRGGR